MNQSQIDELRKAVAQGSATGAWIPELLDALERKTKEAEGYREALVCINKFHKEGFTLKDLEARVGFLGWTCCCQLQTLAGKALQDGGEVK